VREQKLADETTVVDKEYKLPDGKTIRIGYERFKAAEVLFRPESAGWTMKGIA
jgi:actin-related protein 2